MNVRYNFFKLIKEERGIKKDIPRNIGLRSPAGLYY